MKSAWFACVLLLFSASAAEARVRRIAPIRVRMVAFIGEKVAGTRPDFTWKVNYRGKRYDLHVLNMLVLGGGATPLDIDAAVRPYQSQFQLAGEKTALQRFVTAPPRQQVLINGLIRLDAGARYILLDTVEVTPPPTPSPSGWLNPPQHVCQVPGTFVHAQALAVCATSTACDG